MAPSARRLVVGRDPVAAGAAPLVGLLGAGVVWLAAPSLLETYTLAPDAPAEWAALAGLVVLPALVAWWNDGLVVCWLLDFGPLFAVALFEAAATPTGDQFAALYAALAGAALGAVGWGTAGFVVGVGLRRTFGSLRTRWLRRTTR